MALDAAEQLVQRSVQARVVNMHTIKPLDEAAILEAAAECSRIVTAEEHHITGGLGGAVAELLARERPDPNENDRHAGRVRRRGRQTESGRTTA